MRRIKCEKCALRARSGDVLVARVVVSLIVDAVVGLTLGFMARVDVVVFVVAIYNFLYLEVYSLHTPSVTVNCCCLLPNYHCNSASN